MSLQIAEHHRLDDRLRQEWQELWQQSSCGHFFNSPQWLLANSGESRIVAVRDNGRLVAVVPLLYERKAGFKALVFPGGKNLSKSGLLVAENGQAALLALTDHLAKRGSFYLAEMDEPSARLLIEQRPGLAVREASVSPYIPLTGDPLAYMSKRQRYRLTQMIKKHQSHLSYVCHHGCLRALETAYEIDTKSPKRKKGKPTFVRKDDVLFLQKLIREYGNKVTIDLLYYDNIPIAFGIGFAYKYVYHDHNTSYHEAFRRLSPRKILLHFLLARLKREGLLVFDFSRGQSEMKQEFTRHFYKQYNVFYSPNPLVKRWWDFIGNTRQKLLDNKTFYSSYLRLKSLYLNYLTNKM